MARECPECKTNHTQNTTFCSECGEFMGLVPRSSKHGESCSHCGKPLRVGANYCTSCGIKVKELAEKATESIEQKV